MIARRPVARRSSRTRSWDGPFPRSPRKGIRLLAVVLAVLVGPALSWAVAAPHAPLRLPTAEILSPGHAPVETGGGAIGSWPTLAAPSSPADAARTPSSWNASGWNVTGTPGADPEAYGSGTAFAYDPALHGDLYFGGSRGHIVSTVVNETWLFNATGWHNLTPLRSPPPVSWEMMAWDAADGEMILFGGTQDEGVFGLNATWAFANGTWANVSKPIAPPRMMNGALFSDAEDGSVIEFGGLVTPSNGLNYYSAATWKFDAGQWRVLNESRAPSARMSPATGWDSAAGDGILFGGYSYEAEVGPVWWADTWTFSHDTWTVLAPSASPPGRYSAVLGDDRALGGVVLFGGTSSAGLWTNDTWVFAGDNWTDFQSPPQPPLSGFDPLGLTTAPDGVSLVLFAVWEYAYTWYSEAWEFSTLQPTIHAEPGVEEGNRPIALSVSVSGTTVSQTITWNFGDGTTQNGSSVTHRFPRLGADLVTVTVRDANGRVANATRIVDVDPPLTFGATVAPPMGVAPLTVRFAGSLAGGDPPYSLGWASPSLPTLGGVAGTLEIDQAGTYWLTFLGTDAANYSVQRAFLVTVLPPSTPTPPSAAIVSNVSSGTAPLSVLLAGLVDGGVPPYSFAWQFSDGTTSFAAAVARTFLTAGTYSATLTVRDADGATATAITTVLVDPAFYVVAQETGSTAASSVTLAASAFDGVSPYAFYWNWGDGSTSTGGTATHAFARSGSFRVELTGIDASGHTAIAWTNATVVVPPQALRAPLPSTPIPLAFVAFVASAAVIGGLAGVAIVLARRGPPRRRPRSSPGHPHPRSPARPAVAGLE